MKSKLKRYLLLLSGDFKHLKVDINIKKIWYGNNYGGFFVCPDLLTENSVVYSFGIGEDISFDEAIIRNHNCAVYGFDPTPKSIKWLRDQVDRLPAKFSFYEYGISDKSGLIDFFLPKNTDHISGSFIHQNNVDDKKAIKVQMKSLTEMAKELGHKKIDVLKMDIEGAEYQVLDSILNSGIHINQLALEFHDRFFEDGKERTIKAIEKLKKHGFGIFGVSDSLEEISLINKKIV